MKEFNEGVSEIRSFYVLRLLLAALILVVMSVISLFYFRDMVVSVFQSVEADTSIFVFNKMTTSLLFCAVCLVISLVYMIVENSCRLWVGRLPREGSIVKGVLKWCQYGVVGALIVAALGPFIFNIFWSNYFWNNGYSSCSNMVLDPTSEVFNSVWVKNREWCEDPKISMILRKKGDQEVGVGQANDYIERVYGGPADTGPKALNPPFNRSSPSG